MRNPLEYDVVIVGSGVTGLVAAIAAAKAGLKSIVLERTDLIGGSSSFAYSALWVPGSDQARAAGIQDDGDAVMAYANYVGGGENDPGRTRALTAQAPVMLRLLTEVGVRFSLLPKVGDMLLHTAPGAVSGGRMLECASISGSILGDWRRRLRTPAGEVWRLPISELPFLPPKEVPAAIAAAVANDQLGQGASLVAQLLRVVRELGVEIRFNSEVIEIVKSGGRVSGVILNDDIQIAARRGVVLGTGGYLSNLALVAQLESLPGYGSIFPAGADGSGFKCATSIGASIRMRRNNLATILGYYDPNEPDAPLTLASVQELPRAHVIMVNSKGNRFGNEATFQDYATALRDYDSTARTHINMPCWMIFDGTYIEKWGFSGTSPGTAPAWVTGAPTLAELARLVGIDEEGLILTVRRFNAFAESGVDADFRRAPAWDMTPGSGNGRNASLGAIAKPPFFAVKLTPSLEAAGSGIKADDKARVLNWNGAPIPGLYAAGDVTVHDEFGTGYQAGLTLTSAMTFACIAIDDLRT